MIHHINVLHPGVVFGILECSNGRQAVTVDGEFGNVVNSCFNYMASCPAKLAVTYSALKEGGHCKLSFTHCSSTSEECITSG